MSIISSQATEIQNHRPPFKYLIIIEPLGFLYGSAGRFLSPENLVGRSGIYFPPSAATLSGIFAAQLRYLRFDNAPLRFSLLLLQMDCLVGILFLRKSLKDLQLAGPFWAKNHNPQNFYVPTPFNCLVKDKQIQYQMVWNQEQERWKTPTGKTPPNDKFETGTWLPIRHWKRLKEGKNLSVYSPPWKFIPHLHPRLQEEQRHVVEAEDSRGSLFLENSVQMPSDTCLVYLSNITIPDGCYRFGGEGHLVDLRCEEMGNCLQELFNEPVGKYFATITPGVWGSNRLSYRTPKQDKVGNLQWPDNSVQALITQRPHFFRYRLGKPRPANTEKSEHFSQPQRLSRGRYAMPAGTVYVLEKCLPKWEEWPDDWFPKEGVSFKRWGCGLALSLEK